MTLFYVYQDPQVAWSFTKERELVEGRVVPKDTFINAFFQARENIEKVKKTTSRSNITYYYKRLSK